MSANLVFTVGHSNRTLSDFIAVLRSAGILALVDVRRYPASRRHPHFNATPLKNELAAVGIGYRHFPDLGGYRDNPVVSSSGPNDGWPPGFLRNYADYAMTEVFQAALTRRRDTLQPKTALMCAEKSWTDCHRQIISDYLIARRHEIIHVIDAEGREQGALTAFARPTEGGLITYPAARSQLQLDL
ncbi:DUF488 domain-containing protein [Bradyrhizobium prioriisuperbiae]|uniref:DUF488 domain-containing protein n=1 Tax=Bradyrhizobium prioriisuperbiae TaxID=2854389 RepID=UPI0028E4798D|nr:DUF488 domain-containing protein [Bradyrhizobium prioritasuperba]